MLICLHGCADKKTTHHREDTPSQVITNKKTNLAPRQLQDTPENHRLQGALRAQIGIERATFYEQALSGMNEEPLSLLSSKDDLTVRILLHPWKNHPCLMKVMKRNKNISLVVKWMKLRATAKNSELVVNERRTITMKQFNELKYLLALASFWSTKPKSDDKKLYYRKEERMLIEAVSGKIYHVIEARVPLEDVPLRKIRRFALDISGDWAANVRLLEQFRK